MDNRELVFEILKKSGAALRSGDIAEKTGLSKNEVDKAIKGLVADGKITSPKRCYYMAG